MTPVNRTEDLHVEACKEATSYVTLTAGDLKEIEDALSKIEVQGARYPARTFNNGSAVKSCARFRFLSWP